MPSAKLWWPVGTGKLNLYRVRATLTDDRGIMDTAVTRTGLRKGGSALADNQGWRIVDRRLFIKGSNYIGSAVAEHHDAEKVPSGFQTGHGDERQRHPRSWPRGGPRAV